MEIPDAIVRKQVTRIKQLEAELAAERSLWRSDATVDRTSHDPQQMHTLEMLDNILNNEKTIHACSGITGKEYARLFELYDTDRLGQIPMFKDEYRESDPDNVCKLYKRHALFLILTHFYTGMPLETLGAMFGIDQNVVSKYLALNRQVLERFLPTAKTISKVISLRVKGS